MAVLTHKSHTVYTKSLWADAWVATPYLYCDRFSFAVAPDTSDAQLQYHYGRIMKPAQQSFATYTAQDLVGKYVKVAITDGPTWYGIIVDIDDARNGGQTINGAEVVEGTQILLCRGLEYLLQRTPVDSSRCHSPLGGEVTIGRAIGFNLGEGLPGSVDKLGNMSPILGGAGAPIFIDSLTSALVQEWTADLILRYLITHHAPRNEAGADMLGWFVSNVIARQTLVGLTPTLQCEGKTLFHVLNELIDRRRLLGWWIYVDPANEHPEIRLFTFNKDGIILPGGGQIVANQNQVTWDFDQENQAQTCVLASDDASKFHRVLAKGEPQGACFTVSIQGGNLETDWSAAQQTTYNAGDPAAAGLADDWARHNAHQTARTKDSLKKVYRYFRVPPTWDGKANSNYVWPSCDTFNTVSYAVTTPFWWPGLRLQDKLPLRLEHNYATVAAVTNAMKTSSKWLYQRPFVYVYPTGERAYFLDRAGRGETVDTHSESSGRFWSASLQMQDNAFGIIVDVHGAPQHIIANNTFAATDAADSVDYVPDTDYNYMYATVFAEADGHVTRVWPEGPINAGTDTLKELVIHVPNARLDYLVPGTTIDISSAGVPLTSTGGFVRDDTNFLKNVARSAYQWYSTPRKSMQITIHELGFSFGVGAAGNESIFLGSMITMIGGAVNAVTLNSCVTRMTFDLLAGTSTYLTQFAEFDVQ